MKKINCFFLLLLVGFGSGYTGYSLSKCHFSAASDKTLGKPILTVAGVVHILPENKIALIQRGKAPKGLAMFGGHVEAKESPEAAFIREAKEELNIDVENVQLIGLHGKYGRDPRQHSVEGTYSCTTTQKPKAGSDAKAVALYTAQEILDLLVKSPEVFAFDHGDILEKHLKNKAS